MIFKGLFDFKNHSINIKWRVVFPIIILIFVGLTTLSSTSNYSSFLTSSFSFQNIGGLNEKQKRNNYYREC